MPRPPVTRRMLTVIILGVLVLTLTVSAVSAETINGSIRVPQYEVLEYPSAPNKSVSPTYPSLYDSSSTAWTFHYNAAARYYPSQIVLYDACYSQTDEQFAATPNYRIYNGTLRTRNEPSKVHANVYIEYQKRFYDFGEAAGYYTVVINIEWDEVIDRLTHNRLSWFAVPNAPPILWASRSDAPIAPSTLCRADTYPPTHLPYTRNGNIKYSMIKDTFEQNYVITTDEYGINIDLTRVINGKSNPSKIIVKNLADEIIYESSNYIDINGCYEFPGTDLVVLLESYYNPGQRYEIYRGESTTPPGDPGDAILRKGTVTMTDHNGTTITGFEVTAVNHYTDEEYTISTDTDVAVMNLPMDRTTEIRDPWTGEYEEVPIGYYRFYGQAPGYKMLNEEGIKVSVMPEKYSSYRLCDILVTSESGYLTGKHLFQIRSRSDNSILQTGTISAKSATTGEWFNTSMTNGIATLILPYDTSNSKSQYAGNYYVYATSPGYEDSDYGTQIIVMPQTVSEIRTILLTPIGGIPTPGNVTLRIDVFSEGGPGVVNANIFIAGVQGAGKSVWDTYTASSTGYLEVSVPGNSTYDIVASGTGYYDSTRRIEVFTDAPPLIEIKLYLSGAPTLEPTTQPIGWPTTQPTGTPIGPTPTMTAPTGEPVSNWLEWFAAHFGMILGGGAEIGKIFMWLCFAVPVGVYVGKEAKAGAAGFMAGAGIVTLFFVLIGWVPIWLLVLLALIIGLLYAKVFNTQDNGGGR